MFSFQLSTDDRVFHQIPSTISFQSNQQDDLIVLDPFHDHATMDAMVNTNKKSVNKSRKRQGDTSPSSSKPNSSATTTDHQGAVVGDHGKDENTQRKLVHREIERQRRQDMSKLYASLRGLLPLEFVKGKRSTSDHMHQAVNYIKHMQQNIEVLTVKRDQLKKFVETSVPQLPDHTNINEKGKMNLQLPNTISISFFDGGIQILINSCLIEDGFPYSGVLNAISKEGLIIKACTCTKVNNRLLHSIQSEVNDPMSTDISMLQQRLTAVAND
ncbi:transcription factor bHLH118-like [Rutidosis leptorrhynchoides]|uniref:transcription factor bHLH118-like n=1 Tax=Rutidosis leptorrhynchoides TaxID=125765 RepID=UPI003A990CF0